MYFLLQNNLCEVITETKKLKWVFYTENPVFDVCAISVIKVQMIIKFGIKKLIDINA